MTTVEHFDANPSGPGPAGSEHPNRDRAHLALLILVAIIAFVIGLMLGRTTVEPSGNSRAGWPKPEMPRPREIVP